MIVDLRKDYALNFGRAFCDFAICLNENEIPRLMFGIPMSKGVEGIFGMMSALIYLFGLKRMRTG